MSGYRQRKSKQERIQHTHCVRLNDEMSAQTRLHSCCSDGSVICGRKRDPNSERSTRLPRVPDTSCYRAGMRAQTGLHSCCSGGIVERPQELTEPVQWDHRLCCFARVWPCGGCGDRAFCKHACLEARSSHAQRVLASTVRDSHIDGAACALVSECTGRHRQREQLRIRHSTEG